MCIACEDSYIPSLLNPSISLSGKKSDAMNKSSTGMKAQMHSLFRLAVANNGQLSVNMYIEIEINFLGLRVLSWVIDKMLGWRHWLESALVNVIGYGVFVQSMECLNFVSFNHPEGVDPLLCFFPTLCVQLHRCL